MMLGKCLGSPTQRYVTSIAFKHEANAGRPTCMHLSFVVVETRQHLLVAHLFSASEVLERQLVILEQHLSTILQESSTRCA